MRCRPRARESGLRVGELPPEPYNAITDVAGVRVGHTTLIAGDGPLRPGQGPVRTGVTVILPHGDNLFRQKVPGAVHTINGFGKACGFEEVRELGVIEAPLALTNTLNVGLVPDGLVQHAIRGSSDIGVRTSGVNVVVGECNERLYCAETMVGRDGNTRYALPVEEVATLVRRSRPDAVVSLGQATS